MKEKEIKKIWESIIEKCGTARGYEDFSICEEWNVFDNFLEWFKDNDYTKYENQQITISKYFLDNDSKVFSPETCYLIPVSLNKLLSSMISKNSLLLGVSKTANGTFVSEVCINGKRTKMTFKTEKEAAIFYADNKYAWIDKYVDAYEGFVPKKIRKKYKNMAYGLLYNPIKEKIGRKRSVTRKVTP